MFRSSYTSFRRGRSFLPFLPFARPSAGSFWFHWRQGSVCMFALTTRFLRLSHLRPRLLRAFTLRVLTRRLRLFGGGSSSECCHCLPDYLLFVFHTSYYNERIEKSQEFLENSRKYY